MIVATRIYNAIKPLVGNRVYPSVLPDGVAFPCVRYSFPSIAEEPFVDAGKVILRYRVQIEIFAKTYSEAVSLRGSVQTAVRSTAGFIEQGVDFDDFEPDTKLFRWVMDFSFRE